MRIPRVLLCLWLGANTGVPQEIPTTPAKPDKPLRIQVDLVAVQTSMPGERAADWPTRSLDKVAGAEQLEQIGKWDQDGLLDSRVEIQLITLENVESSVKLQSLIPVIPNQGIRTREEKVPADPSLERKKFQTLVKLTPRVKPTGVIALRVSFEQTIQHVKPVLTPDGVEWMPPPEISAAQTSVELQEGVSVVLSEGRISETYSGRTTVKFSPVVATARILNSE